ncbi:expressed unknown protein [Seminavis robusta]|uniref:Uncharacterized protein n=1 Tax=Seminavis robusta TaxID=568900 RepID=A0A9N8EW51_9STRA|nr:expressed unknown protein [Seminavis robusta]|eukprot:Sro1938_g306520.1 n/a (174) ;mRNA; r:12083-12604
MRSILLAVVVLLSLTTTSVQAGWFGSKQTTQAESSPSWQQIFQNAEQEAKSTVAEVKSKTAKMERKSREVLADAKRDAAIAKAKAQRYKTSIEFQAADTKAAAKRAKAEAKRIKADLELKTTGAKADAQKYQADLQERASRAKQQSEEASKKAFDASIDFVRDKRNKIAAIFH